MALLLFKLRNVPDDEAEEIRHLLKSNRVDYYETDAGNWGISMPGLWLNDETDAERAKSLIDDYQHQRFTEARARYLEESESNQRTVLDSFREQPGRFTLYLLFGGVILYFSIKPFMSLISTN